MVSLWLTQRTGSDKVLERCWKVSGNTIWRWSDLGNWPRTEKNYHNTPLTLSEFISVIAQDPKGVGYYYYTELLEKIGTNFQYSVSPAADRRLLEDYDSTLIFPKICTELKSSLWIGSRGTRHVKCVLIFPQVSLRNATPIQAKIFMYTYPAQSGSCYSRQRPRQSYNHFLAFIHLTGDHSLILEIFPMKFWVP